MKKEENKKNEMNLLKNKPSLQKLAEDIKIFEDCVKQEESAKTTNSADLNEVDNIKKFVKDVI